MAPLCSAGKTGLEYLNDFQFMQAIACTYMDSVGVLVAGTLILTPILLVTYLRTGSVVLPFVLILLTGGATMGVAASPVVGLATVVVLVVGAGVIAYAYQRYSI